MLTSYLLTLHGVVVCFTLCGYCASDIVKISKVAHTGSSMDAGSQPSSPPDKDITMKSSQQRSQEAAPSGGGGGSSSQQKVKEAVAIAAGKKGMGQSDDDERRRQAAKSNMLCYLYWLLVMLILGLISFTVWLSIQLARRHSLAMMAESKLLLLHLSTRGNPAV